VILQPSKAPEDPLYSASELHGIVGTDARQPFDMRDVIARIVDGSRFREYKKEYGPTIVTVSLQSFSPVSIVLLRSETNLPCRDLHTFMVMKSGLSQTMASCSLPQH